MLLGLGIAAAVMVGWFAGRYANPRPGARAGTRQALYYVDPMHPAYRSEKPGKAPDCGMDLEPVYGGGEPVSTPGVAASGIQLTPEQEQAARLETEAPQLSGGTRRVFTAGRVAADEALTYSVSAGVDGWVRRVYADRTGSRVKRGDRLSTFYSRDLSAPQQAYLYALESYDRVRASPTPAPDSLSLTRQQLARAHDDLAFLGMGEAQIEELGQKRVEAAEVTLTAPADGQILERHVAEGERFMKGALLYRIASLDRVWVLGDVNLGDRPLDGRVRAARIVADGLPPMLAGVPADPIQFDDRGRTGKIRLDVDNPRGVLVPGMIVNVELEFPAASTLTVNADAVIDSGNARRVFVARGAGRYEPRIVETGRQDGDRVEIRGGIGPGERVVSTGAFLLDSESRMKTPAGRAMDPECGMPVDSLTARRLEAKGSTYFFCSEGCERKFTAKLRQ